MSTLTKLKNSSDNFEQKSLLRWAICEKIESLKQSLQVYPSFFFQVPGIASKKDKNGKIAALSKLRDLLLIPTTNMQAILTYSDNVLDGDTLMLFKLTVSLYPEKFKENEKQNLANRNPIPRLFRLS